MRLILALVFDGRIYFESEVFTYKRKSASPYLKRCPDVSGEWIVCAIETSSGYKCLGIKEEMIKHAIDYLIKDLVTCFLNSLLLKNRLTRVCHELDSLGVETNFFRNGNLLNFINDKGYWHSPDVETSYKRSCKPIESSKSDLKVEVGSTKKEPSTFRRKAHKRQATYDCFCSREIDCVEPSESQCFRDKSENAFQLPSNILNCLRNNKTNIFDVNQECHGRKSGSRKSRVPVTYDAKHPRLSWNDRNLKMIIYKMYSADGKCSMTRKPLKVSHLPLPCKPNSLIIEIFEADLSLSESCLIIMRRKFENDVYNACSCLNDILRKLDGKTVEELRLKCEIRPCNIYLKLEANHRKKTKVCFFAARIPTCRNVRKHHFHNSKCVRGRGERGVGFCNKHDDQIIEENIDETGLENNRIYSPCSNHCLKECNIIDDNEIIENGDDFKSASCVKINISQLSKVCFDKEDEGRIEQIDNIDNNMNTCGNRIDKMIGKSVDCCGKDEDHNYEKENDKNGLNSREIENAGQSSVPNCSRVIKPEEDPILKVEMEGYNLKKDCPRNMNSQKILDTSHRNQNGNFENKMRLRNSKCDCSSLKMLKWTEYISKLEAEVVEARQERMNNFLRSDCCKKDYETRENRGSKSSSKNNTCSKKVIRNYSNISKEDDIKIDSLKYDKRCFDPKNINSTMNTNNIRNNTNFCSNISKIEKNDDKSDLSGITKYPPLCKTANGCFKHSSIIDSDSVSHFENFDSESNSIGSCGSKDLLFFVSSNEINNNRSSSSLNILYSSSTSETSEELISTSKENISKAKKGNISDIKTRHTKVNSHALCTCRGKNNLLVVSHNKKPDIGKPSSNISRKSFAERRSNKVLKTTSTKGVLRMQREKNLISSTDDTRINYDSLSSFRGKNFLSSATDKRKGSDKNNIEKCCSLNVPRNDATEAENTVSKQRDNIISNAEDTDIDSDSLCSCRSKNHSLSTTNNKKDTDIRKPYLLEIPRINSSKEDINEALNSSFNKNRLKVKEQDGAESSNDDVEIDCDSLCSCGDKSLNHVTTDKEKDTGIKNLVSINIRNNNFPENVNKKALKGRANRDDLEVEKDGNVQTKSRDVGSDRDTLCTCGSRNSYRAASDKGKDTGIKKSVVLNIERNYSTKEANKGALKISLKHDALEVEKDDSGKANSQDPEVDCDSLCSCRGNYSPASIPGIDGKPGSPGVLKSGLIAESKSFLSICVQTPKVELISKAVSINITRDRLTLSLTMSDKDLLSARKDEVRNQVKVSRQESMAKNLRDPSDDRLTTITYYNKKQLISALLSNSGSDNEGNTPYSCQYNDVDNNSMSSNKPNKIQDDLNSNFNARKSEVRMHGTSKKMNVNEFLSKKYKKDEKDGINNRKKSNLDCEFEVRSDYNSIEKILNRNQFVFLGNLIDGESSAGRYCRSSKTFKESFISRESTEKDNTNNNARKSKMKGDGDIFSRFRKGNWKKPMVPNGLCGNFTRKSVDRIKYLIRRKLRKMLLQEKDNGTNTSKTFLKNEIYLTSTTKGKISDNEIDCESRCSNSSSFRTRKYDEAIGCPERFALKHRNSINKRNDFVKNNTKILASETTENSNDIASICLMKKLHYLDTKLNDSENSANNEYLRNSLKSKNSNNYFYNSNENSEESLEINSGKGRYNNIIYKNHRRPKLEKNRNCLCQCCEGDKYDSRKVCNKCNIRNYVNKSSSETSFLGSVNKRARMSRNVKLSKWDKKLENDGVDASEKCSSLSVFEKDSFEECCDFGRNFDAYEKCIGSLEIDFRLKLSQYVALCKAVRNSLAMKLQSNDVCKNHVFSTPRSNKNCN